MNNYCKVHDLQVAAIMGPARFKKLVGLLKQPNTLEKLQQIVSARRPGWYKSEFDAGIATELASLVKVKNQLMEQGKIDLRLLDRLESEVAIIDIAAGYMSTVMVRGVIHTLCKMWDVDFDGFEEVYYQWAPEETNEIHLHWLIQQYLVEHHKIHSHLEEWHTKELNMGDPVLRV